MNKNKILSLLVAGTMTFQPISALAMNPGKFDLENSTTSTYSSGTEGYQTIGEDKTQAKQASSDTIADISSSTYDETSEAEVYATQKSTFSVIIPKKITLDGDTKIGSYQVAVKGDIASRQEINVTAPETVSLTEQNASIDQKKDIIADIYSTEEGGAKTNWKHYEIKSDTYNGTGTTIGVISGGGITSGSWSGKFNFDINMGYTNYVPAIDSLIATEDRQDIKDGKVKVNITSSVSDQDNDETEVVFSGDYSADGYYSVGTHTITATTRDEYGDTVSRDITFEVKNSAPKFSTLTATPDRTDTLDGTAAKVIFVNETTDADGDKVTVSYSGDDYQKNGYYSVGTHTITATATDTLGYSTSKDVTFTVKNSLPTSPTVALSYANNGKLNSNSQETVTVNVSGSTDADGDAITYDISCPKAYSVTKVSDTQYKLVFKTAGYYVITVTAKDSFGGKTVKATQVQILTSSGTSGTSNFSQSGSAASFDSGWTDVVDGCYISSVSFSVPIASGHASVDNWKICGITDNGIEEIIASATSVSNCSRSLTLDASKKYRQVKFYYYSAHASCVMNTSIKYNFTYAYDETLETANGNSYVGK